MKSNKPLIRRTFLQERFNILIKKQRNGKLSFNDLTELDYIINRDPAIRESILEEMQGIDNHYDEPQQPEVDSFKAVKKPGLFDYLKNLINRFLIVQTPNLI